MALCRLNNSCCVERGDRG